MSPSATKQPDIRNTPADGKLPIALLVDDGAPCINPLYYHDVQVRRSPVSMPATIPIRLLEEFIDCITAHGVRGKFTVLPYPAGLGAITRGLRGCDRAEMQAWLHLVRRHILPRFDIHPEILTHTRALDLGTNKLLNVPERDWLWAQPEAALTAYFIRAMTILQAAGLPSNGITQPGHFQGDEEAYARALLAAEKTVYGRRTVHFFVHTHLDRPQVTPTVLFPRAEGTPWPDRTAAAVSIPSGTDDVFWPSIDGTDSECKLADALITEDGRKGRLIELARTRSALVFHTHWQSLFSNGRYTGLRGLRLVVDRINAHLGCRGRWMKLSEIAQEAAARLVHEKTQGPATGQTVNRKRRET